MRWQDRAECARKGRDGRPFYDAELWQPVGTTGSSVPQIEDAVRICDRCPVRSECLDYALTLPVDSGILGGLTEHERSKLKRRQSRARAAARPQVPDQPKQPVPRRVPADPARMLIADSGLSFSQVAKRTGLDRDSLSKIARGDRRYIYETTLAKIRDGLAGVTA